MPQQHKIGIVFPVINCLAYTQEALRSLVTFHRHVICIVDNGSDATTREWEKLYYPDNTIANGMNAGLTIAWNQGVEFCRRNGCDLVLITNNDVLYNPKTVDNLVAALDAHPDWGMATAINEAGRFRDNPDGIFDMEPPTEPTDAEHPDFSCFMLRMETYDKVGPFDEEFSKRGKAFFEDNDYHRRMQLAGIPARCTTSAPYFHHGSVTANTHRDAIGLQFEQNRAYYIEKWGGMPGQERFATPFGK